MKRSVAVLMLCLLGTQIVEPAFAARIRVVHHGPRKTTVVVRRGWPILRPARVAYIRPARYTVRIYPARFWAPVLFTGAVVAVAAYPAPDVIVWEDGETLYQSNDWTEFTLGANARGKRLWLEVKAGRIQFDWAEVAFGSGEAAPVDFKERTYGPGLYDLLDFQDGRLVDHVRILARAKTDEARVVLRMQKG